MPEHQLFGPFTWVQAPGLPDSGQDWKITFQGPEDKTVSYHVHLSVLASNSHYFSKYALDNEEKYRETANREVVLDWSELDLSAFDESQTVFSAWLDLVYKLIGYCNEEDNYVIPYHLGGHKFFVYNSFLAACILDYFDTPATHCALFKQAKLHGLAVPVAETVASRNDFHVIRGTDWHNQWIVDHLMAQVPFDADTMQPLLDDLDLVAAVMDHMSDCTEVKKSHQESLLISFAACLAENKDRVDVPFFEKLSSLILSKKIVPALIGPTEQAVSSLGACVTVLEIEDHLGLSTDLKEHIHGTMTFTLTDLQDTLTTSMSQAISSGFTPGLVEQWSDSVLRLTHLPQVSHAFQVKQVLFNSMWRCVICKISNDHSSSNCVCCGSDRNENPDSFWRCPTCLVRNKSSSAACPCCAHER